MDVDGVAAAVGLCLAAGVALELVNKELPHREQEGLESIIAALAVGAVTFMIVWMRKHARSMSKDLRASAGAALAAGSTGALVAMAFFAVFREGMETSVFLLAAFQSSTDPVSAGFGALLGVLVAVAIGVGIYRGGVKLNFTRFFRMTGVVLVFVAAGLVASALHAAHDAGWLNAGQGHEIDLSWLVVPGTWTAALLTGMLGLRPSPALAEVAGYLLYALPMLMFLLLPDRFRPRPPMRRALRSATTATLLVLVAGVVLTACGGSDDDGAAKPSRADASAVATTYADIVLAAYDASIASTGKLSASVDAFLEKPSSARLAAARKGVAERTRRLRRHRGVSLLRRPDRRPAGRPGGQDQRVADGRGLRRLRARPAEGRHRQRHDGLSEDHGAASSSRPTSGVARRTSRRAGMRSSSCCGARTARRPVPATGRRATTRARPTRSGAGTTCG